VVSSFANVIDRDDHNIIGIGRYSEQIPFFTDRFSKLSFYLYDDLSESLVSTSVCDAIGVRRQVLKMQRENVSVDWRFPVLRRLNHSLRSNPFLLNLAASISTKIFKKILLRPTLDRMRENEWQRLVCIYKKDIQFVENLIRRDLYSWMDYKIYLQRSLDRHSLVRK
jgi:hypothetical protein